MVAVLTERRSVTRVTLRCVPLTPIHIGDGTEMRLDEYVLEGPQRHDTRYDEFGEEIEEDAGPQSAHLCRFDTTRALRAMTTQEQARFRTALNAGRLVDAAEVLRSAGRRCVEERIAISQTSFAELAEAIGNPDARSGQVKSFVRTNGRPYIPGSSVKGAFRTALASTALPRETRLAAQWTHESALQAALGMDPNDTSKDPLRFLSVSDAVLPNGATLIGRAEVVKPGGVPASSGKRGGIQMHYEHTRSLCGGNDAPNFDIYITVDGQARHKPERVEARFDSSRLLSCFRSFHIKVFRGEIERFFRQCATGKTLTELLLKHRSPDRQLPVSERKYHPHFIVFRLGRFGHFESKSLDGVRRGHFPQARDPARRIRQPDEWGSTRTVTRLDDGTPIPFGWVLGWVTKEETL